MTEQELPDGLWESDGKLFFECLGCEQASEWPAEPEDFVFGNPPNMCGGSPRCIP